MSQRVRGQETFISVLVDGELRTNINSITSAEWTLEHDVQEDNFLGETSPRFDMIFKGATFRIEGQLANRDFLDFAQQVKQKASRRVGGAVRIDITSTMLFPNGQTYTVQFEDVAVGAIPISTGGREDFTAWTLEGSASDATEVA